MAAPVTGEADLPLQNSDIQLINNEHRATSASAEDDLPISQFTNLKTSSPNPTPPAPLTYSLGKRRKSKPVRYGVFETVEKKNSHSKPKVVHDPSSKCLSSPKESSATKCSKLAVGSSPAMIRAGEVQSSLRTEHPSCIKLMVKAHVGIGYWMGFPQPFSKLYLPKTDTTMVIEDENGDIYHIRYIAHKYGLSAGWKKFADEHNLLEGDVLVFHLIEPCKLKETEVVETAKLVEVMNANFLFVVCRLHLRNFV